MAVEELKSTEPTLSEYFREGILKTVGARYHLATARSSFFEPSYMS